MCSVWPRNGPAQEPRSRAEKKGAGGDGCCSVVGVCCCCGFGRKDYHTPCKQPTRTIRVVSVVGLSLLHFVESMLAVATLRLGTLNVNARESNFNHFAELVERYDLDVFCLNECTRHLAHRISQRLNGRYQCIYAKADYAGNALFSRFPVKSVRRLETSGKDGIEVRSAAVGTFQVDVPTGEKDRTTSFDSIDLTIMGTHLSHVEEDDRIDEFEELLAQATIEII